MRLKLWVKIALFVLITGTISVIVFQMGKKIGMELARENIALENELLAEEESDRHDYPGSPMYDEYPDRDFLYQVRNAMFRRGAEWGQEADDRMRDLAFVLLLGEVSRRRAAKE